jgi:hypothetical protein
MKQTQAGISNPSNSAKTGMMASFGAKLSISQFSVSSCMKNMARL